MRNVKLIARHFIRSLWKGRVWVPAYTVWLALVVYAIATGYFTYTKQNAIRLQHQAKARESWDANPDKHPHRMAHFGSFAFRIKHPLSMFETGVESFTGNAVFLEAHKQNTVNYSEAGFSTGLLRFGEVSLGMLVQIVLPLILFFLGFNTIAQQRENGTLKVLVSQGASFQHIIWGNTLGLFIVSALFLLPVLAGSVLVLLLPSATVTNAGLVVRTLTISLSALAFAWLLSAIAIGVSAISKTGRTALLSLLGTWLLLAIVLPKALQAIGSYVYPTPAKAPFEAAIETDLLKQGDSHNPADAHFKKLKDSVLRANKVDSIQALPFNYSGFVMQEGERMSAEVYNHHLQRLYNTYDQQNQVSYTAAFVDPFICFRNISMGFSGTDFAAYRHFQQQAEAYRYKLAQTMNNLQIKYISNQKLSVTDKPYSIEKHHWTDFPDFNYQYQCVGVVAKQQWIALVALVLWLGLSVVVMNSISRKAKVI